MKRIFCLILKVVILRLIFQLELLQSPERDFTIKISGLEIYNENVRDLLNSESGRNLKLLDDPEVVSRIPPFYNVNKLTEFGISYFCIIFENLLKFSFRYFLMR